MNPLIDALTALTLEESPELGFPLASKQANQIAATGAYVFVGGRVTWAGDTAATATAAGINRRVVSRIARDSAVSGDGDGGDLRRTARALRANGIDPMQILNDGSQLIDTSGIDLSTLEDDDDLYV